MDKDCPKCGLINPPSAERCDCGYDFATRRVARSYSAPDDPEIEREIGLNLAEVGRRNMRIGPFVALAGIGTTLMTWSLAEYIGVWLIAWGAIAFGIGQFFRGLGQLRRSRQA